MKIAILGTRGIPNNYGGFEQFAEYLSTELVRRGHAVSVYNSSHHIFQEDTYKGVQIIHKNDPENKIGTVGQFIYDLNCIIDSRKRHFDVILNLGYTSSSIWSRLFPKKSVVITNMDGQEWKRTKFSKKVQRFLMYAEKLAVKHSDHLVSDSKGIQSYLKQKYNIDSTYIAYGATPFDAPNEGVLEKYELKSKNYHLLIARIEPENNIETILDGISKAKNKTKTIVIGNAMNTFGLYLQDKYADIDHIVFMGPVYDITVLNNLRYYSKYYFHGHSVGGTNPSLLEAMAAKSFIIAHDNEFNKSVLEENACYFNTSDDVCRLLDETIDMEEDLVRENNYMKIKELYSWDYIIDEYESLIIKMRKV